MMIILHFFLLVIMMWSESPDTSDNAWLAIKIKAETPKGDTSTEAQSVEPLQKDLDN